MKGSGFLKGFMSGFMSGFTAAIGLGFATLVAPAHAVTIAGIDFPQGAVSFADQVVDYMPGIVTSGPRPQYQGAFNALGAPDYTGANGCGSQAACSFVSLGVGGSITLRFTDNLLTGSNSSALDLWVFEVGPGVEDTFVWISQDGSLWHSVGSVGGSMGIDIDAFGFGVDDHFGWVRLQDNGPADAQSGANVGADIDAVGAISTVRVNQPPTPTPVPLPGTVALLGLGLVVAGVRSRKR